MKLVKPNISQVKDSSVHDEAIFSEKTFQRHYKFQRPQPQLVTEALNVKQPNPSYHCAALLASLDGVDTDSNPKWVTLPCDVQLNAVVICSKPRSTGSNFNRTQHGNNRKSYTLGAQTADKDTFFLRAPSISCPDGWILVGSQCYIILRLIENDDGEECFNIESHPLLIDHPIEKLMLSCLKYMRNDISKCVMRYNTIIDQILNSWKEGMGFHLLEQMIISAEYIQVKVVGMPLQLIDTTYNTVLKVINTFYRLTRDSSPISVRTKQRQTKHTGEMEAMALDLIRMQRMHYYSEYVVPVQTGLLNIFFKENDEIKQKGWFWAWKSQRIFSKNLTAKYVICMKTPRVTKHTLKCKSDMFPCQDGSCILNTYVCDNVSDCVDGSDESDCSRSNDTSMYRHPGCEQLDTYRTHPCCWYADKWTGSVIQRLHRHLVNNPTIEEQVERSIGLSTPRRTTKNSNIVSAKKSPHSNRLSTFPCADPPSQMYHVEEVCVHNKYLWRNFTCDNGRHVDEEICEEMYCPSMYKCSYSYCIPVYSVCDGVVDCQSREDEMFCESMSCPGLLKCRGGSTCVPFDMLCDGTVHCLNHQDDEIQCLSCPRECLCAGYVMICSKQFNFLAKTAFIKALIFTKSLNIFESQFISPMRKLLFLDLESCDILGINHINAAVTWPDNMLKSLLLANNLIIHLKSNMLRGLTHLKYLDLSDNTLELLENKCFQDCSSLEILRLENNNIITLMTATFHGLINLKGLSINRNPILFVDKFSISSTLANLLYLYTTDIRICLQKVDNVCSIKREALSLYLIPGYLIRILTLVMGCIAASVVFLLLFIKLRQVVHAKQYTFYQILEINKMLSDVPIAGYPLFLWIIDFSYGVSFIQWMDIWKTSFECKFLATILILFKQNSLSTSLIIGIFRFLATSRPFLVRKWNIGQTVALRVLFLSWMTSTLIAGLCYLLFTNASGGLPFVIMSNSACNIMIPPSNIHSEKSSHLFLLCLIFVVELILIIVFYALLLFHLKKARLSMEKKTPRKQNDNKVWKKIFVLLFLTCFSWIPTILLAASNFLKFHPTEFMSFFLSVTIIPMDVMLLSIFTLLEMLQEYPICITSRHDKKK